MSSTHRLTEKGEDIGPSLLMKLRRSVDDELAGVLGCLKPFLAPNQNGRKSVGTGGVTRPQGDGLTRSGLGLFGVCIAVSKEIPSKPVPERSDLRVESG